MFKWLVIILMIALVGVWAYGLGILQAERDVLPEVYGQYNYLHMYEDGSYVGETVKGERFSGCIPLAICND